MKPFYFNVACSHLKIGSVAVEQLQPYMTLGKEPLMAGGILIGRLIIDSPHIIVDEITTPFFQDIRRPDGFQLIDVSSHQRVLQDRWDRSAGTSHFLGNWHSRPTGTDLSPSSIDRKEFQRIAVEDGAQLDFTLFLIVGPAGIAAYRVDKGDTEPQRLFKEEFPYDINET